MLAHLVSLGLHLNAEKSSLIPAQSVQYLGLLLDSVTMKACLTQKRKVAIRECISECMSHRSVSVVQCQRLLGLFAAASQAVSMGLLHTRPLQYWFGRHKLCLPRDRSRALTLSRACLKVLTWWRRSQAIHEGVPLGQGGSRVTKTTDTSLTGWGDVLDGRSVQRQIFCQGEVPTLVSGACTPR